MNPYFVNKSIKKISLITSALAFEKSTVEDTLKEDYEDIKYSYKCLGELLETVLDELCAIKYDLQKSTEEKGLNYG